MDEQNPDKSGTIELWLGRQSSRDRATELSIIVPAFNEQWRLPTTLIDIIDFMDSQSIEYEVIVVDDGSSDATGEMVRKFERIRPQLRLLRSPANHGKGHAVRMGILNSYGKLVLFADADGSTPIQEVKRLLEAINDGADIAIGSRALISEETRVTTNVHRKFLGRAFNLLLNVLILPGIADTQCGFKLFKAPVAKFLAEHQRINGFGFDVELLFIAQRASLRIAEVPINWTNVPGSKVNLVFDAIAMARDAVLTRIRHRNMTPATFQNYCEQFKHRQRP